jgi:hypothetical protein
MKKALIFTGLVQINKNLVGTAVIYKKMAELLVKEKYEVILVIPAKTDMENKNFSFHVYNKKNNNKLINQADLVIFGSYPPIDPLLYAYKKRKKIISYRWSIAPIGSLEFKDFKNQKKQNDLHQYIINSYNLSLLTSDKIFCRDEQVKKLIMGSLISLGRINLENYKIDKKLNRLIEVAAFGIDSNSPKHNNDIYRGKFKNIDKNDFLLIWNGGIWNWNDGQTLIKAMNVLKGKKIKLIFQGFRHPQKNIHLSSEAEKTINLTKKLGILDKNVFFMDKWVPFEERGNFLTEADLGIITSPNIPEANLFLKTRIYDYLWAKLPIILNDSEAFAEIIKKNELGLVAKTGNYLDLAEKILNLKNDKKLYSQIKNNIENFKKQISWNKTLTPLKNYLKNPTALTDKYNQKPVTQNIKDIAFRLKNAKI